MRVAKDQRLMDAEQYAKNLFLDQPGLGIDDAARIINDQCDRSLVKSVISDIRRDVRQKISNAGTKGQALPVPPVIRKREEKAPFNPPRFVVPQPTVVEHKPEPMPKLEAVERPKPASAAARATKLDRQKFLEGWCLDHPLATIEDARQALRDQFGGMAMGTKIIADTLRMARKLWEQQRLETLEKNKGSSAEVTVPGPATEPTPEVRPQPTVEVVRPIPVPTTTPAPQPSLTSIVTPIQSQIASLAKGMKDLGVRCIHINDDGTVRVEFKV